MVKNRIVDRVGGLRIFVFTRELRKVLMYLLFSTMYHKALASSLSYLVGAP